MTVDGFVQAFSHRLYSDDARRALGRRPARRRRRAPSESHLEKGKAGAQVATVLAFVLFGLTVVMSVVGVYNCS